MTITSRESIRKAIAREMLRLADAGHEASEERAIELTALIFHLPTDDVRSIAADGSVAAQLTAAQP